LLLGNNVLGANELAIDVEVYNDWDSCSGVANNTLEAAQVVYG
jgi:hypothetical protein